VDSSVDADVIVAGAGPAGAVAARTLAQSGLRTLLVDKAAFPRNKPCGGGVSTRALRRFPWLDARLAEIDVHRISKLHLEGPHGTTVDIATADPSVLLLRRVDFDHLLVREAVRAGATLVERFEVTQAAAGPSHVTFTSRDGRTLRAPAVVAADGVHSVTAKRLGVNARWPETGLAIDMMEETPLDTLSAARPDVLWVAYAYRDLDGYAYIFPKTHHVNVGIGCLMSHFKREVDAAPYELQQQFVSAMVEAGELHGRSDRGQFTPFLIPLGGPLKPAHHGRVLFAGDAGGFVNAITAEGIYYAMVSGELAGRALSAVRGDGVAAGPVYDRLWRRELGTELDDAVLIQRYLFSSHERVARLVRGAAEAPALVDLVLRYVSGSLSYAALRRRMFVKFPAAIWRMARQRIGARLALASGQE
jgi:geranylgeranyl reductase family protein